VAVSSSPKAPIHNMPPQCSTCSFHEGFIRVDAIAAGMDAKPSHSTDQPSPAHGCASPGSDTSRTPR